MKITSPKNKNINIHVHITLQIQKKRLSKKFAIVISVCYRVTAHNHIVRFGVLTFFSVFLRLATFSSFSIVSYSNSAP